MAPVFGRDCDRKFARRCGHGAVSAQGAASRDAERQIRVILGFKMSDIVLSEDLRKWIERVVGFPFRLRHKARAREKHKARVETLETVRKTLEGAARLNAANIRIVFNVGLYVLLLDQDLA